MSIHYPEAAAARAAWERACQALAEIDLEGCLDGRIPPRVFRHGGRQWRIVGPYIAELSTDGDGGIVAVFTSDGKSRGWGIVEYLCLDDGSKYPIED